MSWQAQMLSDMDGVPDAERVSYLLEVLNEMVAPADAGVWKRRFPGLRPAGARLLAALAAAAPAPVPIGRLRHVTAGRYLSEDEDQEAKVVHVVVCHARKALVGSAYRIVTVHGFGYALGDPA